MPACCKQPLTTTIAIINTNIRNYGSNNGSNNRISTHTDFLKKSVSSSSDNSPVLVMMIIMVLIAIMVIVVITTTTVIVIVVTTVLQRLIPVLIFIGKSSH